MRRRAGGVKCRREPGQGCSQGGQRQLQNLKKLPPKTNSIKVKGTRRPGLRLWCSQGGRRIRQYLKVRSASLRSVSKTLSLRTNSMKVKDKRRRARAGPSWRRYLGYRTEQEPQERPYGGGSQHRPPQPTRRALQQLAAGIWRPRQRTGRRQPGRDTGEDPAIGEAQGAGRRGGRSRGRKGYQERGKGRQRRK